MARTRTYAELETAMFDQSELVWRYLSGLDRDRPRGVRLTGEVVDYWQDRWRASSGRRRSALADGVARNPAPDRRGGRQRVPPGRRGPAGGAYRLAQRELKGRLQPALTQMNREIYRRARESSVRGAYSRLEEILARRGPHARGHHRPRARSRAARRAGSSRAAWPARCSELTQRDGGRRRGGPRPPDPAPPRATRSATWPARSRA